MQQRAISHAIRPVAAFALALSAVGAGAQAVDPFAEVITGGDAGLELRYRYEFVDQDGFDDNAHASTLRLRLNFETGEWQDFSAFVEFDHVAEVLLDDYNSGAGTSGPGRDRYPVVADPDGTDLNQLYLQYAPRETLKARIGRQRILLDDERFVGGVGWRQNEQTYDSLSVHYGGLERTDIFYAYVTNVNRIFGDDVPAGDHDQNTHLLNVDVTLNENLNVIGYSYLIDNDDAPAFSTNTFGLRVTGNVDPGIGRIALHGEYAMQTDAANNPADFDADYFRVEANWSNDTLSAGLGLESLGSDNDQGFRTPLATLHAFNGWADQFLTTPGAGLEDLYLRFGYRIAGWQLQAIWHDFSAEAGGGDYGSEIDLAGATKLFGRYSLLLKAALFSTDTAAFEDTSKIWMMITAPF